LRYTTDRQIVLHHQCDKTRANVLENEFAVFLRNYVEKNPTHIEHSLLLADAYLRNEQTEKAEIILRDALRVMPQSPVLLEAMLDVYARGKKYDEVTTTLETLATIDSTNPTAIDYRFREYLKNEQFDQGSRFSRNCKKTSTRVGALLSICS
jgi:cytochrome c-type biogenesis protein CcmH/NrfG